MLNPAQRYAHFMKFACFFAILNLGLTATFAATVRVADFGDGTPSRANAQSAYNAASAGDTIIFPGGNATWTSSLTISKPLTIKGNGTTLIAGAALDKGFFYITGFTSNTLMRISGFVFNMANLASNGHGLLIYNNIELGNLRVDHNTFHHGDIQVEVGGSKGVFDHNYFYNGRSCVYFTAGSRAQADASWVSMAAGTADALFFEDNQFIYDSNWLGANENNSCFDTYNGGKLVVRYNSFTATNVPASWTGPLGTILTHGNAAAGLPLGYWQAAALANRAQSVVEIYYNTINAKRADFLCQLRGAANLVHHNVLDTTMFTPTVNLYEEEQTETQFSPLRTAWPGEDQVHNSFFWSNTLRLNGTANVNYINVSAGSANYIQQGRDFFLHAPEASGGKETFTGANGASGSFPTDNITYPSLGTMVFTSSGANAYFGYTEYTYPHPLTAPDAPTNLRLTD
jgi:hypothetical protein